MNEEVINKTENEELKGQLLNLFKEDKIELDPEISDVIDEVFDEFDLANGEEDSVNIYFKEDKDVFERDLTINNNYQIKVNGLSSGVYTATYTFIDNLDYAMNEKTILVYDNTLVETLVDFTNKDAKTISNIHKMLNFFTPVLLMPLLYIYYYTSANVKFLIF